MAVADPAGAEAGGMEESSSLLLGRGEVGAGSGSVGAGSAGAGSAGAGAAEDDDSGWAGGGGAVSSLPGDLLVLSSESRRVDFWSKSLVSECMPPSSVPFSCVSSSPSACFFSVSSFLSAASLFSSLGPSEPSGTLFASPFSVAGADSSGP